MGLHTTCNIIACPNFMAAIGLRYDHGCDSLTIFTYRSRFFHSLMTVHLNASALPFPFPALDGLQFFHWFPLFRFVLSSDPLILQ